MKSNCRQIPLEAVVGWLLQKAACRIRFHSIYKDLAIKQTECVCTSVVSLFGFAK